jgi:hypothetical protein
MSIRKSGNRLAIGATVAVGAASILAAGIGTAAVYAGTKPAGSASSSAQTTTSSGGSNGQEDSSGSQENPVNPYLDDSSSSLGGSDDGGVQYAPVQPGNGAAPHGSSSGS